MSQIPGQAAWSPKWITEDQKVAVMCVKESMPVHLRATVLDRSDALEFWPRVTVKLR